MGFGDRLGLATPGHLAAVRKLLGEIDVLVFTLGLTETWEAVADGTAYPVAPGTLAGAFDPARYRFRNLRYPEIRADMEQERAGLERSFAALRGDLDEAVDAGKQRAARVGRHPLRGA